MSNKRRIREPLRINSETGQYELFCNTCETYKPCDSFYVKYKDRPHTTRSHWQEKCIACVTVYRKQFYSANKDRIRNQFKEKYRSDPEFRKTELEKHNRRKLQKSKDPKRLLTRRMVHLMDPQTRYLWDKIKALRQRANKAGLEFDITFQDLQELYTKQKGLCYYTDKPLILGPNDMFSASVDRIDSERGYIKDNIVLCGVVINLMKLDSTLQEFYDLVQLLAVSLKKVINKELINEQVK